MPTDLKKKQPKQEVNIGSLHAATLKLLQDATQDVPLRAVWANNPLLKESVTYHWLYWFLNNKFKSPSVDKVQVIYDALSTQKLKV